MTITMDKLNSMIGVVGEYVKKMNVISNTFKKANDYQSFLKVNEDNLVFSKCFVALGKLYVDTHSSDVELPVEVVELFNKVVEIASNRCLVIPDDDYTAGDDNQLENFTSDDDYTADDDNQLENFTVKELSIIYKALGVYRINLHKENKLSEFFKVWDLSNKVLNIQERIFLRR